MAGREHGALASGTALAVWALLAGGVLSADQVPAAESQAERVVVVGDSLSTGFGTSARSAWPLLLAESEQGMVDVVNASENGDGYLTVGEDGGTFGSHAASAVTPATGLVVFFGSENDIGEDPSDITDAAVGVLNAARETAPSARIVVVGPTAFSDSPEPELLAIRDALRAAASQTDAEFIDPLAENWLANPDYEGLDGDHPTVSGQEQLRDKMTQALGLGPAGPAMRA